MEVDGTENTEVEGLEPFTHEDAKEDDEVCADCKHKGICAVREFVNKLSQKKYGTNSDNEFGCTIFSENVA